MKGGIAAFVAGLQRLPRRPTRTRLGSISLLITGDEEGPAKDGTTKVLDWMAARGRDPRHALVGEPTSRVALGDLIKVGRRGSMTAYITLFGTQGHSAYPQRADNPIHRLVRVLHRLTAAPIDQGIQFFEAIDPAGHRLRCRQRRQQRHPRRGPGDAEHPLQRPAHAARP